MRNNVGRTGQNDAKPILGTLLLIVLAMATGGCSTARPEPAAPPVVPPASNGTCTCPARDNAEPPRPVEEEPREQERYSGPR